MELIDQDGVIDTNILIYHLTDCLGDVGEMWLEKVFDLADCVPKESVSFQDGANRS